jgi:hypothetical protein
MVNAYDTLRSMMVTYLMDGNPVDVIHLVKLINAHNAPVCQNHGASLQALLTCTQATPISIDPQGAVLSQRHSSLKA